MAGEEVADRWIAYPWDATSYGHTIREHERLAKECSEKSSSENDA